MPIFRFAGLIIAQVRRQQIDEQDGAEEIAAGENGDLQSDPVRLPVDEKAAEKFVLRLEKSQMHLRQRAPKHQHAAEHQTGHRQLERREN